MVFYHRQYRAEYGEKLDKLLIIDDTTCAGTTLSRRRLQLMKEGVKLKNLGKAAFFLGDLIKLAHRQSWFIDNTGKVFQYKKSRNVPLVFRRITKIMSINSGGNIIEIEGFNCRFKTLYNLKPGEVYAGVLVDGLNLILYGVYTELHKDTRRMI